MEIIKPNGHNFNYLGDASANIADLPVRVSEDPQMGRTITSAWQPSREELAALMNGGSVELTLFGSGQPPVMLSVAPVNLDLFRETPLVGVVGYCQRWKDVRGNWPDTYTFDVAREAAVDRLLTAGWEKVGEPFPVSQAFPREEKQPVRWHKGIVCGDVSDEQLLVVLQDAVRQVEQRSGLTDEISLVSCPACMHVTDTICCNNCATEYPVPPGAE